MPLHDNFRKPPIRRTHGMVGTRVYQIWASMISRCRIKSATGYENYGGRGIAVCDRWLRFEDFYADMGDPLPGMSLDRIDCDGNYAAENCRWVERADQNRNQRDLMYLTHDGKTQCLAVWAREVGMPYAALRNRKLKGWPDARILTTPVRAHKPYERRSV